MFLIPLKPYWGWNVGFMSVKFTTGQGGNRPEFPKKMGLSYPFTIASNSSSVSFDERKLPSRKSPFVRMISGLTPVL